MERLELSHAAGENVKWYTTLENGWAVSYKYISAPWPIITLLIIYQRELKAYIHQKICGTMLLANLFIIAKLWKNPNIHQQVATCWRGSVMTKMEHKRTF